ncbi:MAG: hypothetical protein RSD87_03190, partial [Cellulosilyticaceae bacterium]
MKKRGFIKAILVAATIALSSITVLATENSDVMGTITETHKAYEIEATEAESYVKEGEIEIKEEVKPEESKPEVKEEV